MCSGRYGQRRLGDGRFKAAWREWLAALKVLLERG